MLIRGFASVRLMCKDTVGSRDTHASVSDKLELSLRPQDLMAIQEGAGSSEPARSPFSYRPVPGDHIREPFKQAKADH